MTHVAIAYNTGRFKPERGLKQGHKNAEGKFYGELFFDFLRRVRTVALPDASPVIAPPPPGSAATPPAAVPAAAGDSFEVDTMTDLLRLRSTPEIPADERANVRAQLPDGHRVRAMGTPAINGFLEVETTLSGALLRGFVARRLLKPLPVVVPLVVAAPATTPPTRGIVAAHMPRRPGSITRRTNPAGAHSLNEPGQPGRRGATAEELRREQFAIIDWLAVEKPAHARYKPQGVTTFCNIYAHDFCHLAGVYLPRVWWTGAAIEKLARGETVEPKIGDTIEEYTANRLFHWLRDFGPRFGWRRAASLTELQTEAGQGSIGVLVARRVENGRPGHIVMVVPETPGRRARRDASGEVVAPLQSQAGAVNFRFSAAGGSWWNHAKFAESAFWLHP